MIQRLRAITTVSSLALLAFGCADPDVDSNADEGPERAAYLTLMGNDTLAAEWMEFGDGYVDAEALIRGAETTWNDYHLELAEDGSLEAYTARTWSGGSPQGEPARTEELVQDGDGWAMVSRQDGEEQRRPYDPANGVVPFVDMLHWPFETDLRRQARAGTSDGAVNTFSGRGMSFALTDNGDGTWGLRHPSRGVSTMHVDDQGRILSLDGTGSTRAYDLTRTTWDELDRAELGARFADRPLGELSGRGQVDDDVAGVHFTGHYGEPQKRGRDIFGGLLAYGTWWRTGANQATHFSFDGDIVVDGERIPAGDYTLSSIPEEDGGVLIINRRTGQGGQSYEEAEDQARVRMRRASLDEVVESFQIRVVPDQSGDADGRIELRWDDTVYWVPFSAG